VIFYNADGVPYETTDPVEVTRLRMSRGHTTGEPEPDPDPRFHPENHDVASVMAHLEDHPEDHDRVLAEERGGKARKSILGTD
jgi:hypothetical protein